MSNGEPTAETAGSEDPLRDQLLAAASRVFASKGYFGTKIMDIVREAGLSSGAVYGRFTSKDELLMEAVLSQVDRNAVTQRFQNRPVGEILAAMVQADGKLDDAEAMWLEAFIAARRESKVASAIAKNRKRWRKTGIEPFVQRAIDDGLADPDADFESVVYLMETLHLGLLVQRGAGQFAPDPDAWERFVLRMLVAIAGLRRPSTTD